MKNITINEKIAKLRKESKLTQAQLADYLGIDQSMVTKIEHGTRTLNMELIDKLCDLYGCTEAYLFGESDEYLPINFAFRSNTVETEDLQSIAAMNKIAMNLRFMDNMKGDD